jgi:hypothetical protein
MKKVTKRTALNAPIFYRRKGCNSTGMLISIEQKDEPHSDAVYADLFKIPI